MTRMGAGLTLAALLAACSSSHQLPANYAPTQAAISAADAVGARQQPRAALHLKMARDQLTEAESLARDGKEDEASLVLDRARTDAELALMVTREANARAEATKAANDVQRLGSGTTSAPASAQ